MSYERDIAMTRVEFDEKFQEMYPALVNAAYAFGAPSGLDADIVHDVYVKFVEGKLYKEWDEEGSATFRTYVTSAVFWAVKSTLRRPLLPHGFTEQDMEELTSRAETPDIAVDLRDRVERIRKWLDGLSRSDAALMNLVFLKGMSHRTVASHLGTNRIAIDRRVKQILRSFAPRD